MPLIMTSETPRAAFGTSDEFRGIPDREIPRMLAEYLKDRFPGCRARKTFLFWGPRAFEVDTAQGAVGIVLLRSKIIKNGWRLTVVSRRLAPPHIRAAKKPPRYDPAELEVCRPIHSFLTETPGIVDLRWYFQSAGSQTSSVRTPEELPWHES